MLFFTHSMKSTFLDDNYPFFLIQYAYYLQSTVSTNSKLVWSSFYIPYLAWATPLYWPISALSKNSWKIQRQTKCCFLLVFYFSRVFPVFFLVGFFLFFVFGFFFFLNNHNIIVYNKNAVPMKFVRSVSSEITIREIRLIGRRDLFVKLLTCPTRVVLMLILVLISCLYIEITTIQIVVIATT